MGKKILSILIATLLLLSLASCGGSDVDPIENNGETTNGESGDNPIISKTPPTAEQWASAGIAGTFTAEVKGELALSVVQNGEISMKWTGSDEASLDNTITWLKGQGFRSYGGQSAEKTAEEGGKMMTYTAEKTVGGMTTASANGSGNPSVIPLSFTLTSAENKTMIAESIYITEDFSIMGQSFKGGELYLDIYEAEAIAPQGGLLTEWPAAQIQNVIGSGIPAYMGTASGYQLVDSSASFMKTVQINVFGAGEADATAYNALLAQNGFVLNDDEIYAKTLANGDVIQVMAFASQSYHPSTFQISDVVTITVMLEKNSGSYTSWSSLNLSEFNEAGIPAYSGGTSFDIDDATADGVISTAEYEQIIAALEMAEQMGVLDEEDKAELDEAKAMIALAQQVKAKVVTVYGTNADQAEAYETALTNAGFANGIKKTTDYQYEVNISEDEGKAIISITKLPIELVEDEDSGGSGSGSSDVTDELDWNDFPTNVKFTLNDGAGNDYVITKIENDFLIEYSGTYTCLKASGNGWNEYLYNVGSWMQGDSYSRLDNHTVLGVISDILFDNDVSGFNKDANETVAGVSCEVYTYTDDTAAAYGMTQTETKKVNADGFVFYKSEAYTMNGQPYMTTTYQLTLWDTSVTEFAVALPQ